MITIYWGVPDLSNFTGLRHTTPVSLLQHHLKDKNLETIDYNKCPAFRKSLENIYCGMASVPFTLNFNEQGLYLNDPSQGELFNKLVVVRSIQDRIFSWNTRHIFFTDTESLDMTLYAPHMEDNDFTNNTTLVSGVFDIGKWFRPAESTFIVKSGNRTVTINENDPLYYLKFHTEEKIQFKRFICTPEIYSYASLSVQSRKYHPNTATTLDWYYNIFGKHKKFKNLILKKIKENLID